MEKDSKPPPVDRLRSDIDRGVTGEKNPWPDPAAAPLGTDAEAGGDPPSAQQREAELRSRPHRPAARERSPAYGAYLLVVTLAAALILVLFWTAV